MFFFPSAWSTLAFFAQDIIIISCGDILFLLVLIKASLMILCRIWVAGHQRKANIGASFSDCGIVGKCLCSDGTLSCTCHTA